MGCRNHCHSKKRLSKPRSIHRSWIIQNASTRSLNRAGSMGIQSSIAPTLKGLPSAFDPKAATPVESPIYHVDGTGVPPLSARLWGFILRASFLLCVLLPISFGAHYYAVRASDQFVTEARMVVRTIGIETNAEEETSARVTMLAGQAVVQDAHIVVGYLKSMDLVRELDAEINLRALFQRPEIDPLSRLGDEASLEDLHDFWESQTAAYVDGPSGIIAFRVQTFTPEDAMVISQAAIARAAELIESLSNDARQDLVRRAAGELSRAQAAYVQSLDALRDLQNEAGILNPVAEATVSTELITGLLLEKLDAEAELMTLRASGVQRTPKARQLENQIATLEAQIDSQRQQMVSLEENAGELSGFFAQINALETERLLRENLYRSASRSYELASSNAQRQSTFLSVFSPPMVPSESTEPMRLASWLMLVFACLAAWGSLVLVWAAIEDHRS